MHRRLLLRPPWSPGDTAVIVSAALVLLALARVYFFTAFDLRTTLAILGVVDRTQLLLATVAAAAPPFVASALLFAPLLPWRRGRKTPLQAALITALVVIALPIALATSSAAFLVLMLIFVAYLARDVRKRRKRPQDDDGSDFAPPSALAALLVVWIALALARPWLPLEQLTLDQGKTMTGYVIGAEEDQYLVSLRRSHVAWVAADEVKTRQLCTPKAPWPTQSVLRLLGAYRHYPACAS